MRWRRLRWWRTAPVVALVMLAGCGDDVSDVDRLAGELVEETSGALDDDQAACVAEGLVQSFGDDAFREVIAAADGDGESAEDVRVQVIDIFASCDALEAVVLDRDVGGLGPQAPEEPAG